MDSLKIKTNDWAAQDDHEVGKALMELLRNCLRNPNKTIIISFLYNSDSYSYLRFYGTSAYLLSGPTVSSLGCNTQRFSLPEGRHDHQLHREAHQELQHLNKNNMPPFQQGSC